MAIHPPTPDRVGVRRPCRKPARLAPWLCMAVALGVAGTAHAGDDRIEINHACATGPGCTPSDAPGYPVTLNATSGKSYVLTSDLVVPSRNTSGVTLIAPGMTIDLNGFAIVLLGCQSLGCAPLAGAGYGIESAQAEHTVRNGSIVAMGADGLNLGDGATVEHLRVRWNGGAGVIVGENAQVTGVKSTKNGSDGPGNGASPPRLVT